MYRMYKMYKIEDKFLRPSLRTPLPTGIQHSDVGTETLVPHTFWIHKRASDGVVVLHYKEFAADAVWMPPLVKNASPLVMDPAGIEFSSTLSAHFPTR